MAARPAAISVPRPFRPTLHSPVGRQSCERSIMLSKATPVSFTVEPSVAAAVTTSHLVSFNLDWHMPYEGPTWGQNASILTIDLKSSQLRKLTAALAPAYLRIGGSEGDLAVYDIDSACERSSGSAGVVDKGYCLKPSRWVEILKFAADTGIDVVFGLNVLFGRNCTIPCSPKPNCHGVKGFTSYGTCSPWDPSNAEALLTFTAASGLRVAGFEVGNEKEHLLTPADYAACIQTTRKLLNRLWPDPTNRPLLIGPDQNPRADWLGEMLRLGGSALDVVTYHLYPGYGLDPSLATELLEPGFLDFTRRLAGIMRRTVVAAAPRAQLWVGETAAAWHNGRAGVTDAFASGFWYVDQLGTVASEGHAAMCRQCLVGGNYSMLGVNDGHVPRPDYYTALLFKRLMGTTVLTSYQSEPAIQPFRPTIRAYVHCTPRAQPLGNATLPAVGYPVPPGSATLAYVNVDSETSYAVHLDGVDLRGHPLNASLREEYVLTPVGAPLSPEAQAPPLSSPRIALNGKLLELGPQQQLPALRGRRVEGGKPFVAPPHTYGFVVFPHAGARACM